MNEKPKYIKLEDFEFRNHWLDLFMERNKITQQEFTEVTQICDQFQLKLNNFIAAICRSKNNQQYLFISINFN